MFRAHRAHHQERQIVSIQPMEAVTLCRWPCRVQVRRPAHDTATDSYHRLYWHNLSLLMMSTMCSKHVESLNVNKYIQKNCASRWSFTKNNYIKHGQQNIKKTLKNTCNMLLTERLIYRVREIICKEISKEEQSFIQFKNPYNCVRFPIQGTAIPAGKFL